MCVKERDKNKDREIQTVKKEEKSQHRNTQKQAHPHTRTFEWDRHVPPSRYLSPGDEESAAVTLGDGLWGPPVKEKLGRWKEAKWRATLGSEGKATLGERLFSIPVLAFSSQTKRRGWDGFYSWWKPFICFLNVTLSSWSIAIISFYQLVVYGGMFSFFFSFLLRTNAVYNTCTDNYTQLRSCLICMCSFSIYFCCYFFLYCELRGYVYVLYMYMYVWGNRDIIMYIYTFI